MRSVSSDGEEGDLEAASRSAASTTTRTQQPATCDHVDHHRHHHHNEQQRQQTLRRVGLTLGLLAMFLLQLFMSTSRIVNLNFLPVVERTNDDDQDQSVTLLLLADPKPFDSFTIPDKGSAFLGHVGLRDGTLLPASTEPSDSLVRDGATLEALTTAPTKEQNRISILENIKNWVRHDREPHARLRSKIVMTEWIERHPLEYHVDTLQQIMNEKYLGKNDDELDIFDALGVGAVLEMEDPRGGRTFGCLRAFYGAWEDQIPFSGQAFFDWLDWGGGRNAELVHHPEKCSREIFRGYAKFNATEKEEHRVDVRTERIRTADGNANEEETVLTLFFPKSGLPVPAGRWSFTWDTNKEMYLVQDREKYVDDKGGYWKWGHCSVNGGQPVLHSGEVDVGGDDGVTLPGQWISINPRSGHYRPHLHHIRNFYLWLRDDVGLGEMARHCVTWERLPEDKYTPHHLFADEDWIEVFKEGTDNRFGFFSSMSVTAEEPELIT